MSKVVYLSDNKPIPPKEINDTHAGQKYRCVFDPNADKRSCWVWTLNYVRTYKYYGTAPTPETATIRARRKIHELNLDTEYWEERE